MNYFIRDRLIQLGLSEEAALKHMRSFEAWEYTLDPDERCFLVIKGNEGYLTSISTPSLEGETPCLVFEIGKENNNRGEP
jgi:hypothetical protein